MFRILHYALERPLNLIASVSPVSTVAPKVTGIDVLKRHPLLQKRDALNPDAVVRKSKIRETDNRRSPKQIVDWKDSRTERKEKRETERRRKAKKSFDNSSEDSSYCEENDTPLPKRRPSEEKTTKIRSGLTGKDKPTRTHKKNLALCADIFNSENEKKKSRKSVRFLEPETLVKDAVIPSNSITDKRPCSTDKEILPSLESTLADILGQPLLKRRKRTDGLSQLSQESAMEDWGLGNHIVLNKDRERQEVDDITTIEDKKKKSTKLKSPAVVHKVRPVVPSTLDETPPADKTNRTADVDDSANETTRDQTFSWRGKRRSAADPVIESGQSTRSKRRAVSPSDETMRASMDRKSISGKVTDNTNS